MKCFLATLVSVVSAGRLLVRPMDPKNLMDAQHKDGETMGEDWGQEYGPKQFQWRKDNPEHGLDDFDKNIARDATSAFDKKHAFPAAPAGAPGPAYAPVDMTGVQSMDTSKLGDQHHVDGETMGEDWGQEYGPKQFQWRKGEPTHKLDQFDKNLIKDGASPAGAPGAAPAR
eukprot:gnl/MRDRNA2_/MRDRNA2_89304_c0_seq1.p1 gnl/MRDRNA2_/MRDRNA2_89304_c0~~gnl/MRDRNA2_/MRDRNA2_89304_c0_seq1.p1  ORF type:complete len:171 (+),score=43.43 gnl/MRDRNA2_/MRDRNA2_89304_c0_seq1:73-585(+)